MPDNTVASQEYKELIRSLEDTPRKIKQLVGDLGESKVRERSGENTWSVVEHVCHLRDIEKEGYAVRITKLLTEDHPLLEDIEGDKLAVERVYINQDFKAALDDFINVRRANIDAIRDLSAEQLSRSGMFDDSPLSLLDLLKKMRQHDHEHIDEMVHLTTQLRH
jgi:hypothetical protein